MTLLLLLSRDFSGPVQRPIIGPKSAANLRNYSQITITITNVQVHVTYKDSNN